MALVDLTWNGLNEEAALVFMEMVMSKITCASCGKRYRPTKQQCPVCKVSARCKNPRFFMPGVITIFVLLVGLLCGMIFYFNGAEKPDGLTAQELHIPSLVELVSMSPEDLDKMDVALINLVCAEGLHGSEKLDVRACLAQIDEWALEIGRMLREREFMYDKVADKVDNSINRWRCGAMGQYMSQVLGLSYNQSRKNFVETDPFATDYFKHSRDFMIHGLVLDKNRGNCSSMPVLYAAIARRLGFPVELVKTYNHLFARWDDQISGEVFNIEWTDVYVDFKSNEFYMNFRKKISTEMVKRRGYLRPLTHRELVASFLHSRAMCLWHHGRLEEAHKAFIVSYNFCPINNNYIIEIERQIRHNRDVK